ncbi:MAG: hypothetical protein MUP97_16370, partial [Acidimicrobiia bacterium]|nr:hypothetical protein [Acidimicrobiia bacterium]
LTVKPAGEPSDALFGEPGAVPEVQTKLTDTVPPGLLGTKSFTTVNGFGTTTGTTCTATETAVPAGYTSSGPCSETLAVGTCTITNTLIPPPPSPPPPSPPPPSPPPPPAIKPIVIETPVVVNQPETQVRANSSVRRRAYIAGQSVRLAGKAPAGCDPILRVDEQFVRSVTTDRSGNFDISTETRDLASGRHVAEVFCTRPAALLLSKTFWIAAPVSSSFIVFVALMSLLVLLAIGWVGLRTLAGTSAASQIARPPGGSG